MAWFCASVDTKPWMSVSEPLFQVSASSLVRLYYAVLQITRRRRWATYEKVAVMVAPAAVTSGQASPLQDMVDPMAASLLQ